MVTIECEELFSGSGLEHYLHVVNIMFLMQINKLVGFVFGGCRDTFCIVLWFKKKIIVTYTGLGAVKCVVLHCQS